jgi:hypothetical protein
MCTALKRQRAQSAAHDPRETALESISCAAAEVAVSAGAPTDWRLCQILTAIDLFEQDLFDLAIERALRAELPIDAIPKDELAIKCPRPFGAVLHTVRQLRDGMSRSPSRDRVLAIVLTPQFGTPR